MRLFVSHHPRLMRLAVTAVLLAFASASLSVGAGAQTRRKKRSVNRTAAASAPAIPRGTELKLRLGSTIDTKNAKDGDRFTATVLDPSRYSEARVEGHVARVAQSGKLKGKTQLSLNFDRITFSNGTSAPFAAQLVRVYGEGSAKNVSEEGDIESGSKGKTTTTRTAGGAAAGAAIGAIAGGGKGAAIGAIVGAAAGAGSTYIQGSNRIKLDQGTELLVKTIR